VAKEYAALFAAFWQHVFDALRAGDMEMRLWLDTGEETGGFLKWCEMTGHEPQYWRSLLLRLWVERP
jgi:hypothetical protein